MKNSPESQVLTPRNIDEIESLLHALKKADIRREALPVTRGGPETVVVVSVALEDIPPSLRNGLAVWFMTEFGLETKLTDEHVVVKISSGISRRRNTFGVRDERINVAQEFLQVAMETMSHIQPQEPVKKPGVQDITE